MPNCSRCGLSLFVPVYDTVATLPVFTCPNPFIFLILSFSYRTTSIYTSISFLSYGASLTSESLQVAVSLAFFLLVSPFIHYCSILFNSSVTRHTPSKIDEMSRLSRSFWASDETVFRFEKTTLKCPKNSKKIVK
jgi:hypothetical protein